MLAASPALLLPWIGRLSAPPTLYPSFLCTAIDTALIPQGAPALLRGAQLRVLDGRNPNVTTHVAAASADGFPAHGLIIHIAQWA